MVSIRRRRLLAVCSGWNSFKEENGPESANTVGVHPVSLNNTYKPKEDTISEDGPSSSNISASTSLKDQLVQQSREFKRRKRHRRKHVENQEPCIMRGVYFKNLKWQAAIKVDKKQIHLGTVGSQEEAARLYDRAAFMCGREPNFELSEEEKQDLMKYNWDQFLAMTRSAITNKKSQRRSAMNQRKYPDNEWEMEEEQNGSSASGDDRAR